MNREVNMKCCRGGGSHPLLPGASGNRSCRVQRSLRSKESSITITGIMRPRNVKCWASLMHWGLLLIVVNSIVLCSCNSISINSESSSLSRNTVLGADGHDEASVGDAGGTLFATAKSPTTTTTIPSGNSEATPLAAESPRATDASAPEKKKKDYNKKESGLSNNSSYSGKGSSVRINESNNTTSPLVAVSKPKTVAAPAGKEYWNKQQKVSGALKAGKKGKYNIHHAVIANIIFHVWGEARVEKK